MRAIQLFGRSIFIRELLPQDLKIELETLTRKQAMNFRSLPSQCGWESSCSSDDTDTRSKWSKNKHGADR